MLREATEGDRDDVRRWRNHPQVRRSSLSTHEIGAGEHAAWWSRALVDPDRRILVYCRDGAPAGVVTFTGLQSPQRAATWGFYLDVDGLTATGQLLPAWLELEKEAIAYAFDELRLGSIGGETLAWNAQVIQAHRRFGFQITRRYEVRVDGEPQEVVWTELRAADRRK